MISRTSALVVGLTLFVSDSDGGAQKRGILACLLGKTRIGGDHHEVRQLFADNLFTQDGQGIEGVNRDAEETLDLGCDAVKRDHTICSGYLDRIGTDTGTD